MKATVLLLAALLMGATLTAQTAATGKVAATPAAPADTTLPEIKRIDFKSDPHAMEFAKQAGAQAIRAWIGEFLGKQLGPKNYAVLPIKGDIDGGYFSDTLSSEFANAALGTEYSLYTSANDPILETLNNELMVATEDREDIFDQSTIQKYNRVNVQGLIVGRVSGIHLVQMPTKGGIQIEGEGRGIQVRILLRAYENSTGRILWGGERVFAVTMPTEQFVVKRSWLINGALYGAGGIALLILLFIVHRMLLASNRPR
jgi:hypothetical protein